MNGYRHIAHGAFIVGNGRWDCVCNTARVFNAFEVSNNGHSIVYDNLGTTGGGTSHISSRPAVKGARYSDNTCVAWGRISAAGTVVESFGVDQVHTLAGPPGTYVITLDYTDPYTGAQLTLPNGSSVVATIETTTTTGDYHCDMINATPLYPQTYAGVTHSQFVIRISTFSSAPPPTNITCTADQQPFTFAVFARP